MWVKGVNALKILFIYLFLITDLKWHSCYTHCNATGGQCDSSFYRPGASFKALVTRIYIGNVLTVWAIQQISHSVLLSWAGGLPFFFFLSSLEFTSCVLNTLRYKLYLLVLQRCRSEQHKALWILLLAFWTMKRLGVQHKVRKMLIELQSSSDCSLCLILFVKSAGTFVTMWSD